MSFPRKSGMHRSKFWITALTSLGLVAGAASAAAQTNGASASAAIATAAQNPNLWPAPGRDNDLTRFSPLKQINTSNAGNLQFAWSQSLNSMRGQEGQPLVVQVDGKPMMFLVSGWPNFVQALDLSDPDNPVTVWNYVKKDGRDQTAVSVACCDTVNRGLNYADGKVIFHTLDGYLIALDAKTGKVDWTDKIAYPAKGETMTAAGLIAGNNIIIGYGGSELAARGSIAAYSIATGKEVWKCWNNGSAKDVCMTANTNKAVPKHGTLKTYRGTDEYPKGEYLRGGSTMWGWVSYDPKLNLFYYGTSNPGTWSPTYRCKYTTFEKCNDGTQDNKWSLSIMARNASTGELVWAYQMTPFDQWDYDGINGNILVNMDINGEKDRPVLVHFDRNGFAYVLDRRTGQVLRAHNYVYVNWAEKIDVGGTDRPIKVKAHSPFAVDKAVQACPSAMGGKDQQPVAVDPSNPKVFYVPTNQWCMDDTPLKRTSTQQGSGYAFANVFMYEREPGVAGQFQAFNVDTGKIIWKIPDKYPTWSGALATAGGVVFYGALNGDFRAVDAKTGKILWQKKLGSGIIGNPMTYQIDGKQYVSVFAGIGGWIGLPVAAGLNFDDKYGAIGATAMAKATKLNLVPQGGTLYTFRLGGSGAPSVADANAKK
ncbi:MAG TPA: PQQ-dependent dehydrogenase, methanol/ethanol family [Rhodanobacteraceae bacterium]|jgi:PQQ-dependent dehydrogenase (methanol/ethanol family)|nr:PQQ-dependent dehydrogenase, methanol/ethanol family [Rhodanobacteraceae bacterium]